VPTSDNRDAISFRRPDPGKPLPPPRAQEAYVPPPFEDVPLVNQQTPEQPAFVNAYRKVGAPRIVIFVNRTLEGSIVPVNENDPLLSVERTQRSTTGVDVDRRDTYTRDSRFSTRTDERSDRFQSTGPGEYRDTTNVYLRPGQYDEIAAKSLDYEAMELTLTDWLSCNGQVTIISPTMARQRLSDEQVKQLQAGRPQVMSEIVQQLGADILIQAQARPTRQTREGLEVRMLVEALNVKGGERIASAWVDVPPPLEKTTINRYTRFLARKLMDGMLGAWSAPPPPAMPGDNAAAAPSTQP
jgi:hypothetical protein